MKELKSNWSVQLPFIEEIHNWTWLFTDFMSHLTGNHTMHHNIEKCFTQNILKLKAKETFDCRYGMFVENNPFAVLIYNEILLEKKMYLFLKE